MTLEERGLRPHQNLHYVEQDRYPQWGKLRVEKKGHCKYVIYENHLYKGGTWKLTPCFDINFTDREILQSVDVWDWLTRLFGERGLI